MSGPESGRKDPPSINSIRGRFEAAGFGTLTEIQTRAIPLILGRTNSLLIAPTGSGKTESSVIPIFYMVRQTKGSGRIKVLYVTPLRALNRDVFRRVVRYAEAEGLSIGVRHGDTPQKRRRQMADQPPDVLITTPETLVILLTQPKYLAALSELEWAIIDEVHELLPSERGAQLSLSLERLQANSTPFARVGLSATVGNPEDAARFIAGTDRPYRIARDSSVREYDVEVLHVRGTVTDVVDSIIQRTKTMDTPVLLFSNTRGEAELLASLLRERSNTHIELHHGSLSREVREETEDLLRGGRRGIVVCTSSLELGLDIGSVDLVIHYGSPRQVSKLVQRIGRSRHSKGASAKGLIITNHLDDKLEADAIMQRIRQSSMEPQHPHHNSLDVLAHHAVGIAMQLGSTAVESALELARGAFCFAGLEMGEFTNVLELLDANYLVVFDRENQTFRAGRTFKYYFENLSTIPDILKFRVMDSVGRKYIGTLDQRFVGDHGEPGSVFVLRGQHWRIINVDDKALLVNVQPIGPASITVPYWEGESIPVDFETASLVEKLRSGFPGGLVAESNGDNLVIHSCMGTRINATLTAVLTAMLSSILGTVVEGRFDAYRIALSRCRIHRETLVRVLSDRYDLEDMVSASLAGTHNINWRTWCVAKKFGMVKRGAVYERRSARFLFERYRGTPLVQEALRELFHDKYDIAGAQKALSHIRDGLIPITWQETNRFSELAEPILDHATKYYSNPANMDKGILDMVKARLLKTKHRLVCMRCGRWERSVETGQLDDIPPCKICSARQVAATYYTDYELSGLVQKKRAGKKLTPEEKHRFDRAWKVSSLLATFGKTALVVLSGYGVGADTAARILRNMVDEEYLYRQIYESERQYVLTRGFWD